MAWLTGVEDAFVVQIGEASERISYDGLFGDGRKSCGVDMQQPHLTMGEDENVPLGDAVHGCPDMGRVFDVLLKLNDVVEVAWDDVLENELLPLVPEIER